MMPKTVFGIIKDRLWVCQNTVDMALPTAILRVNKYEITSVFGKMM